jgi:hypothetical protein
MAESSSLSVAWTAGAGRHGGDETMSCDKGADTSRMPAGCVVIIKRDIYMGESRMSRSEGGSSSREDDGRDSLS